MQAAALPGVLVGGKLSDAIGRKKIIVTCQATAVILFIASLLVGFTPLLPFLIAGASVALAMTWPISGALVADLVPPDKRKSAYALLYWGNNIGFSIGPLAAGFLFHRAPGLMFLGNACALSVSIFVMTKFVPETRGPKASVAVSREAGEGIDEAGGSEKPNAEADYSGSLFSVLRQRPTIWMFSILVAIMNFVYSQYTFSLPLYLNEKLGERGAEIFGSAMTVNGLTVVVFTPAFIAHDIEGAGSSPDGGGERPLCPWLWDAQPSPKLPYRDGFHHHLDLGRNPLGHQHQCLCRLQNAGQSPRPSQLLRVDRDEYGIAIRPSHSRRYYPIGGHRVRVVLSCFLSPWPPLCS